MDLQLGNALNTEYDADGFPGVQVDVFGGQQSGAPPFELHHTFGFLSTPLDPEKDSDSNPTANCCSVAYGYEGSRGHVWLCGDPRVTPKLPNLIPGSSLQYSADGSYMLLDNGAGKITIQHFSGATVRVDASGVTVTGPVISLGAAPSGVATATTMAPLLTAIQALCAALTPFANSPLLALSLGTGAAVGAAATALATLSALPTNFSQTVKAGA